MKTKQIITLSSTLKARIKEKKKTAKKNWKKPKHNKNKIKTKKKTKEKRKKERNPPGYLSIVRRRTRKAAFGESPIEPFVAVDEGGKVGHAAHPSVFFASESQVVDRTACRLPFVVVVFFFKREK